MTYQKTFPLVRTSALGAIRTPNLLIRSQMLYPLSYERRFLASDQQFFLRWASSDPSTTLVQDMIR